MTSDDMPGLRLSKKISPLFMLLLFWWVSLTRLDRWPTLHNDEVLILRYCQMLWIVA